MAYPDQVEAIKPARPLQFRGGADTGSVHQIATGGVSGAGGALPHLNRIQFAFGEHDVTGVSAHVGGAAAEANAAMGSKAYATGNRVAFASSPDLHTAAHEAAHVVQQRAGVDLPGGVGQVGDRYEKHADAVADAVVAGRSAERLLRDYSHSSGGDAVQHNVVQHGKKKKDWEADLKTALGDNAVKALIDKAGKQAVASLAKKLDPADVQTIVNGIDKAHLQTAGIGLASTFAKYKASLGAAAMAQVVNALMGAGEGTHGIMALFAAAAAAGASGAQLATIVASSVGRGWTSANVTAILNKAKAKGCTDFAGIDNAINDADPPSAAEVVQGIDIHDKFQAGNQRYGGQSDPATLAGGTSAKMVPAGNPAQNVEVYIAGGDLLHYKSGHSYPDYALTRGNIRRAPQSTLFPEGTDIAAKAMATLTAAVPALQAAWTGGAADYSDDINNYTCGFQLQPNGKVRLTQFFPADGSGEPIPKGALLTVKALVDP
jgi:hypothetical protein